MTNVTRITKLHEYTQDELLDTFIEVNLPDADNDFLKVRETLERMGILIEAHKTLYQSCHLLHKRGRYYITHFKEMFALDGREVNMTDEDYARRNTIAKRLEYWGLVDIVTPENADWIMLNGKKGLTILKNHDRKNYALKPKYRMGTA